MRYSAVLVAVAASVPLASAQTVFTGLDVEFTKPGFGDPNLAENQDRITDNVWITRDIVLGIFNIAQEPSFQGMGSGSPSPIGTRWAAGSAADFETLEFGTWGDVHAGSPPLLVGQDLVMHLVDDDIYIDVRFTAWGGPGQGGTFTYERSAVLLACNAADNAPPFGILDLADINGFVEAFQNGGEAADIAEPFGVFDLADINGFVAAFLTGCP